MVPQTHYSKSGDLNIAYQVVGDDPRRPPSAHAGDPRRRAHRGVRSDRRKDRRVAAIVGARVREQAAPGEVLVTSTVRDLTSGSGLVFEDRGTRALKGVPREWQLFAAS
jgi:hypothetical protein